MEINVITVECPDHFDEDSLACFWCDHSDECRRDYEYEDIQSKTE